MARLQKRISDVTLPPSVVYLLSASALTALNKIEPELQEERLANGLDPELRTLSTGSIFLKASLRLALASDSGRKSVARLHPIQCQNTKYGIQKLATGVRAAHENGNLTGTTDIRGAFYNTSRQKVLDTLQTEWPEAVSLVSSIYGEKTPQLYRFYNCDGELQVSIIYSANCLRVMQLRFPPF